MTPNRFTRRGFMAVLLAAAGGAMFWRSAGADGLTPSATEGPFYPTKSMRMADVDNDLVKVMGLVRDAGGEVITLKGKITDDSGAPHAGYRIEIWQCDLNGKYLHTGDDRNVEYDQGFQGFGHDITDAEGMYQFRTIKPGKYPGRTPHIHVKVFDDSQSEVLTTQFYVAGDPDNANDRLFQSMSDAEAESVSMAYTETSTGTETVINVTV